MRKRVSRDSILQYKDYFPSDQLEILLRYGCGSAGTLDQVGKELNMSAVGAGGIWRRALKRLGRLEERSGTPREWEDDPMSAPIEALGLSHVTEQRYRVSGFTYVRDFFQEGVTVQYLKACVRWVGSKKIAELQEALRKQYDLELVSSSSARLRTSRLAKELVNAE